jgi:hypothetical protein
MAMVANPHGPLNCSGHKNVAYKMNNAVNVLFDNLNLPKTFGEIGVV